MSFKWAHESQSKGHFGLSAGCDQFFESVAIQRSASSSVAKFPTCEAGPYPALTATVQRPSLIIFEWNFGFSLITLNLGSTAGPAGGDLLAGRAGRGIGGNRDPETNRVFKARFHTVSVAKQSRNHFFNRRRLPEANRSHVLGVVWWWRAQMAALVQALSRESAGTNEETETLKLVALFCCAGLLVSILFAIYGPAADLTSGFF
jgi:hypothetical protein